MVLCFGIYARILNHCKHGLPQEKFIPRVVWVVDRKNRCLGSKSREDTCDSEQEEISDDRLDDMEGNKSVVSRLLSCRQGLELRDKHFPLAKDASEQFKAKVMPYIHEDKIAKAVLAVLYIISKDKTIEVERKETFKKYVGMYKDELLGQTKFYVPDFFARILLYTIRIDNNGEGKPYAKKITNDFIEKVATTIAGSAELKWDTTTQTVEIIHSAETHLQDQFDLLHMVKSFSFDYFAQLVRSHHKWDRFSSD